MIAEIRRLNNLISGAGRPRITLDAGQYMLDGEATTEEYLLGFVQGYDACGLQRCAARKRPTNGAAQAR